MKSLLLILPLLVLSAQDLTIVTVPEDSVDRLNVAYAKYQRAKHEWIELAASVATHAKIECPVFSKGFGFILNDPSCEESDEPKVKTDLNPQKVLNDDWPAVTVSSGPIVTFH